MTHRPSLDVEQDLVDLDIELLDCAVDISVLQRLLREAEERYEDICDRRALYRTEGSA